MSDLSDKILIICLFGAVILFLFVVFFQPLIANGEEMEAVSKAAGVDSWEIHNYGEAINDGYVYQTNKQIEITENKELLCYIKFITVEKIEEGFWVEMKESNYKTELLNTTQPCD